MFHTTQWKEVNRRYNKENSVVAHSRVGAVRGGVFRGEGHAWEGKRGCKLTKEVTSAS